MATIRETTVLDYVCQDMTDSAHMTTDKMLQRIARLRKQEEQLETRLEEVDNAGATSALCQHELCAYSEI